MITLSLADTSWRRWVSERLELRDESRVTQMIREVKRSLHPELAKMKKPLEREYGGDTRRSTGFCLDVQCRPGQCYERAG